MKSYALALLAASAAATTWEQDVAIAGGVIYGLTGANNLDQLEQCMTDADIFVAGLIHAFKLVTEGDNRGRIAGYRLITNIVHDFPSYITTCEQTGDDWVQFGLWFEELIHPINLVERISSNAIHNIRPLIKDALYAREFLIEEHYFEFGEYIGIIVGTLTQPINANYYQPMQSPYLQ